MAITDNNADWISGALPQAGIVSYLAECDGDVAAAWRLYVWNISISGAFYPLLHFVEITLRNGLHRELSIHFDRTDWWSVAPLNEHGQRLVKEAREKISTPRSTQGNERLMTKLTFGFWVSLVSQTYDRALWVPSLHRAFPHYGRRRDVLHAELRETLRLRNRVMHHEPIYRCDLQTDHDIIYRVLGYMSPGLSTVVRHVDQVPQMLRLRCSARSRP
jgi:hypothetical protein